jgi:hypothetical protein
MIQFGSIEARHAFETECKEAKAKQTTRYAVSPRCSVAGKSRSFAPGEALEVSDLENSPDLPAWQRLRDLVARGDVLELSADELEARATPSTARYVVAPKGGVGTKRGILGPGREITADDFPTGQRRIDQLVAAGYLIDRQALPAYPDDHFDDDPGPQAA